MATIELTEDQGRVQGATDELAKAWLELQLASIVFSATFELAPQSAVRALAETKLADCAAAFTRAQDAHSQVVRSTTPTS